MSDCGYDHDSDSDYNYDYDDRVGDGGDYGDDGEFHCHDDYQYLALCSALLASG